MTINIDDYVSEDEKKQIAIEVFREECKKQSSEDFERIVNNSAYHVVWKSVEECFEVNTIDMLREKVVAIINKMTFSHVFAIPNAWDRKANMPYQEIVNCVREYRPLLNEKIEKAMHNMPNKEMRPVVIEAMKATLAK